MSNQLRFSGKTVKEAVEKARAAFGPDVKLIGAEKMTKAGLLGKKVSYMVVVEPAPAVSVVSNGEGFVGQLREAIADVEVEDFNEVSKHLAATYAQEAQPLPVRSPRVFRTSGRSEVAKGIRKPQWACLSSSDLDAGIARTEESTAPVATEMVDRLITDRLSDLVLDLTGSDAIKVDLGGSAAIGKELPKEKPLIAIVDMCDDPHVARFKALVAVLGLPKRNVFILSKVAGANRDDAARVARAVVQASSAGERVAVLVDAKQLGLLRKSFLADSMATLAMVDEASARDLHERTPIGKVDLIVKATRVSGSPIQPRLENAN
jgi:hypothetical protein